MKRRDWFYAVLLGGLVLVAYARIWHAGFIWDDESHLTENPTVIGPLGLKEIWTSTKAVYYPLVLTTFWFLHKLVDLTPAPYHILNVLMHAASAVLLWHVLRKLDVRGAWLGAALWALHPVMVQSVAWVTELKNTQSCFFYLLSILWFLKAEDRQAGERGWPMRFGLALIFFAMAITSKPSTVMLPVVLVLCLWWRKHEWRWHNIAILAPFFLISAAASAWTIWEQKFHAGATGLEWAQTWPERFIVAGDAIWFYLSKLFWPHPLIFIYPRWQVSAAQAIAYLPILAALIGLFILWLKPRTWMRPVAFAAAYFVISLFPVLGFFSVYFFRYSFVSDHFQYLASMGPLALVAAGMTKGLAALEWKPVMRAAACGALLLTLGYQSWRQTDNYIDVVTLYNSTLKRNPECWMAHYNLGIALRARGETDQAIKHYREAVTLRPDYAEAHYNLGRLLVEKTEFEEAIAHYEKALAVNANDAEAHNNLGATLSRIGRTEEAIVHYRNALAIQPDYADASHNLANALFRKGRMQEAIVHYEKVLELRPDDAGVHTNLGNAFAQSGRTRDAIAQYRSALELSSKNVTAQSNLAWLLATSSDPSLRNGPEALRLAESANHASGGNQPIVLRILAAACAETGDFVKAMQVARRALQLAESANNADLVVALGKEIALYESGSPCHKP
jgi:Flp pilus assembly protein TadD